MAIIPQMKLFGWEEIEELGDLERLLLVLENMPDEDLIQKLEKERGLGRNDYPVRGMWNAMLAGVVYQHISIESLRREFLRNGQLRDMCGLSKVPTSWAGTNSPLSRIAEIYESFQHKRTVPPCSSPPCSSVKKKRRA